MGATTENPVEVFDYERWEIVREVLLMSGCQRPASRQIVLCDTHQRYDTSSVIGSARNLEIQGPQLVSRAFFSSVPEAEGPYTKVREGHLTDFSIGYRVQKAVWIPENETGVVDGRTFEGPLRVATSWVPRELSVCPIGADDMAKVRADARTTKPPKEVKPMNPNSGTLEGIRTAKEATERSLAFAERQLAARQPAASPSDTQCH